MKKLVLFLFIIYLGIYPQTNYAQKKLSETDQLSFQSAFFEALKQKAIGNYNKAIEALEFCKNLDSTNVSVLFELSKNFFWQKKYFESRQNLYKALKIAPQNIWLLQQAKNIAVAQQNYNEAIEIQKKIVAINPLKKTGLLNLYITDNKKTKALELINSIEKKEGLSNQLKKIRQQILKQIKPKITEAKPKMPSGLTALKKAYKKNNDFKILKQILLLEAAQKKFTLLNNDATKALEIFPSQAILYLYAAKANNGLKKYKIALNHLNNGIDFVIDNRTKKNYYLAFANSYFGLKNIQNANAYKKRASQL